MAVPYLRALLLLASLGIATQCWYNVQSSRQAFRVALPTGDALRARFGAERNLTHHETRRLYHTMLNDVGREWFSRSEKAGADTHELAVGCSNLRWRIRLYARTRDDEHGWLFDYVLAARDVGEHALSRHSVTAVFDTPACLLMLEGAPCPSYASLVVRKRTDQRIVDSCWKSSTYFDKAAGTAGDTEEL